MTRTWRERLARSRLLNALLFAAVVPLLCAGLGLHATGHVLRAAVRR